MAKKTVRKIPRPKKGGDDCITWAGMTVCPHVVYVTEAQKKTIHKMHLRNVARMSKAKSVTAGQAKKKRKSAAGSA
jgi:hypothetical protein